MTAQACEGRRTRTLHQREPRQASRDRRGIDGARLGTAVKRHPDIVPNDSWCDSMRCLPPILAG
jgi:hypothetical protein